MNTLLLRVAIAALVMSGAVSAQWDPGSPDSSLRVNGYLPSAVDPTAHNLYFPVLTTLTLTFDSGMNPSSGIIVLASFSDPDGIHQIPTPYWGGSIDVGNGSISAIQVIADGIGQTVNPTTDYFCRTSYGYQPPAPTNGPPPPPVPSDWSIISSVPGSACGTRIAWQGIIEDPARPPFFLANTQCADINITATGIPEQIAVTGDDGCVRVPFALGQTFPFHGVQYTDMWVSGNGAVFFGGPNTSTNAPDAVAFVSGPPGIAAWYQDWNFDSDGPGNGVYIYQLGNVVTLEWGNPAGMPTLQAFGVQHATNPDLHAWFSLKLFLDTSATASCPGSQSPGRFETFLHYLFDFSQLHDAQSGIIGQTPGGVAIAQTGVSPTSSDLSYKASPTITPFQRPMIEEHRQPGSTFPLIGWDGQGSPRGHNDFGRNWDYDGVWCEPDGAGQNYVSNAFSIPRLSVQEVAGGSISTTPGAVATLIGQFRQMLAPASDVRISLGPNTWISAQSFQVDAGSGNGFFEFERLTFVVPPGIPPGQWTITLHPDQSSDRSFTATFVPSCAPVTTTMAMNDDDSTLVSLPVNVTMYGLIYTQIHVASNGTISMVAPNTNYNESFAGLFSGYGTSGNPSVAYLWCDLNPGGPSSGSTWSVTADTCTNTVTVTAANMRYYNSNAPAGTYVVTFGYSGPDSVHFNYQGAIPDVAHSDDPIVGYSDGIAHGPLLDLDLGALGQGIAPNWNSMLTQSYQLGIPGPHSIAQRFASNTLASTIPQTFTILNDGSGFLYIVP